MQHGHTASTGEAEKGDWQLLVVSREPQPVEMVLTTFRVALLASDDPDYGCLPTSNNRIKRIPYMSVQLPVFWTFPTKTNYCTGSHGFQAGLELATQPRMPLNFSCLPLPPKC